jgi:hypothetical protein
MTLILELLKALGVVPGSDALEIANKLNAALDIISDPIQREAEFAVALAEWRDGKVPTIVAQVIG